MQIILNNKITTMKKILLYSLSLTIASFLLLAGCSEQKGSHKLIGKWKVNLDEENIEAIYEFSETDMSMQFTEAGNPPKKLETTYKVIADNGKVLSLEIIHPTTKLKGTFIFTFEEGDTKANFVDPGGYTVTLIKM